ncbi:hypothetical protein DSO57_1007888 [Entomophthora muscae]|uniref:Uncharacterized protein n=1 Tax=Entomophthora muscae TaxID=34485 RepID=A0ACC2SK21_9FUNG|nr:hypothetical protein DSO57_1007888 [Entomophthora muscae]
MQPHPAHYINHRDIFDRVQVTSSKAYLFYSFFIKLSPPWSIASTKNLLSPANITHNTQGALNESPHDASNDIDQSEGKVKLQPLSPN